MPVTSRNRIISRLPTPHDGAVMTLSAPLVDTSSDSWDVVRETLWVPYSPYFAAGTRRDEAINPVMTGAPSLDAKLVVQYERILRHVGGYPVIELTSLGLARDKPFKIVTDGDVQGQIGSWEGVVRNLPTVTVYWFSETLMDTKSMVPRPGVPPETFGWAASAGSEGVGWYFIGRTIEPLPVITGSLPAQSGSTPFDTPNETPRPSFCFVTDRYVYDFNSDMPPGD